MTSHIQIRKLGTVSFEEGLKTQEELLAAIAAGAAPEALLLLEHEPVYTIGRTPDQSSLRNPGALPHPVFQINRGGQATYHGPGQLVGYPLLDLNRRGRDLHALLRLLEEVIISVCSDLGLPGAARREGLTGVWIESRKIASIGIGVRKWVSMHGFALNVCGDLGPFQHITPCGIQNVTITSIQHETNKAVSIADAMEAVVRHFEPMLARYPLQPTA